MAEDADSESSLSASRALRVLSAFDEARLTIGLGELTAELQLSKPSVSRFLASLQQQGYVERVPHSKRFRPGIESFRVGQLFLRSGGLQERAQPLMSGLVRSTGLTSYLSALSGDSVVILASQEGSGRIRYSIPVGEKLPIHATATGHAALAAMKPDASERLLRSLALPSRTPDTITDPARLAARIELCRRQGYALNWGENTAGVASVAAAVPEPASGSPIVLSLGFPTSQVSRAQCRDLGRAVREAVDRLFSQVMDA